jgi:hypothetical protein
LDGSTRYGVTNELEHVRGVEMKDRIPGPIEIPFCVPVAELIASRPLENPTEKPGAVVPFAGIWRGATRKGSSYRENHGICPG